MKECTQTDKPLVTILLATYNPNLNWLIKQLESLNNQDYPSLNLIVLDDCSPDFDFNDLQKLVKENITAFPYKIFRNEKNLGSTKTFEKIVLLAESPYISFCDQDDIWKPIKISESINDIMTKGSLLSCCDVSVIDGEDNLKAESVTELWKRQTYFEGENLAEKLLFRNFVIGCTVVMDAKTAKEAVPFVETMVHDHWLAIFTALRGKISVCDKKLMQYRIHGENQTGTLAKINSKKEYYEKRIIPFYKMTEEISKREPNFETAKKAFLWAKARKDYFNGNKSERKNVLNGKKFNKSVALFEVSMKIIPEPIFKLILKQIQKGRI